MKLRKLVAAAVAASLGIGSVAFARDFGNYAAQAQPAPQALPSGGVAPAPRQDGGQRYYRQQYPQQYVQPQSYNYNYGYRSAPSYYYAPQTVNVQAAPRYYTGYRLPGDWRRQYYVVNDWNAYNLYAPPSGYTWVQSSTGDYLLVALATGIIASLLLR